MFGEIVIASFLFVGCTGVKQWQIDYPDSLIEERIEQAIEEKYGKNIDLTPLTGEETQFDLDNEE